MTEYYDIFINYKWKKQLKTNCWSYSDVVRHRSSYNVPLLLPWLSFETLKWIRSAFLDEPSGRSTFGRLQGKKAEREEGSKVTRRYTLLTDIGALAHEAGLVAPRTYVHEAMNIGGVMMYRNVVCFLTINIEK